MPQLLPFHGLRPQPSVVGQLDDFVCPPYDVISEQQRLGLLARSPHNVVRLELPAGDYEGAAATLSEWEHTGALVREPLPALYGYRMTYKSPAGTTRQTTGVIGALVLEPPGRGILPHEQTTPKAKSDRLRLIRATRANISPIWCLCTQPGLTSALLPPDGAPSVGRAGGEDGPAPAMLTATATDDDGNVHEIWPITDIAAHSRVAALVGAAPVLVADGHHRYETALAYQAEQGTGGESGEKPGSNGRGDRPGAEAGDGEPGPNALLALVVELSEEHLQVQAIHRVVSSLPPGTDVRAAFGDFELLAATAGSAGLLTEMTSKAGAGIVTREGAWVARPRPGSSAASAGLDSRRVDGALSTLPAHHLEYEHDFLAALRSVESGQADAAVLCRPATVAQIAATAQGGDRMPPKTTFFWPKPRTGLVIRAF